MILGIFSAIANWFRSVFARSEGQIESATDRNMEDPFAIEAIYRRAEKGQATAIDELANVVGLLEGYVSEDEARLKRAVQDPDQGLERMKQDLEGAYAVGEARYKELTTQGKSEADIQQDEEFRQAMEFAEDWERTIQEREAHIAELQERLAGWRAQLKDADSKLRALYRRLQDTKQKRMSAKAEALVATQMEKIASVQAGINLKGTDDLLRRADEAVARMKGRSKAKQRLAGMDDTAQRERFREAAAKRNASSKFMDRVRGVVKGETVEPEDAATDAAATDTTSADKTPKGPPPAV